MDSHFPDGLRTSKEEDLGIQTGNLPENRCKARGPVWAIPLLNGRWSQHVVAKSAKGGVHRSERT
jgi:hypothetical protein